MPWLQHGIVLDADGCRIGRLEVEEDKKFINWLYSKINYSKPFRIIPIDMYCEIDQQAQEAVNAIPRYGITSDSFVEVSSILAIVTFKKKLCLKLSFPLAMPLTIKEPHVPTQGENR